MPVSTATTITQAQREQLDEQGYFTTGVLFDDETLENVRCEFERLWQLHIEEIRNWDELAQQQAKNRPFLPHLHKQSTICADFCRHPVFLDIATQLVSHDIDMTWNQAIIKPPHSGDNAFAWHQDMWYAVNGGYADDTDRDILMSSDTGITVWVAISRTTVDNGTLWVLPGRHKEGLLPHEWNESNREWQGQFDTSWKVPAVMQAGQVLVFRKYLPHGSGPNVSDEVRMAYQIGYGIPGLKLVPSPDIVPLQRDGIAVADDAQ